MVKGRMFDRTILTVKHYSFYSCPRCAALPVVTYDGDTFECGCGGCKCYKASSIYLAESIIEWNKWAKQERNRRAKQIKSTQKRAD